MPSRKQRRRDAKSKRHQYETVWIDAEGNELDEPPPEVLEAGERRKERAPKTSPAAQRGKQAQRGGRRVPQPPSWTRAIKRSGLLMVFFVVIISFGARGNLLLALPQALFFGLLYIPMMYWMDRWIYRRYQARQAGGAASTPRPAKKR